ncbi:MAG: nuclear transport factor 2 family protein [Solirubrobacterales bacterium]
MASERVERLRGLADRWNRGDVDRFLDGFAPGFEFRPDPSFPDARPMSGEELRSWMHQWADTWAGSELEVLELSEHGDAATARARWHLRAADSEIELPVGDFTFVVWFDEADRPARGAAFFDHEQALSTIAEA